MYTTKVRETIDWKPIGSLDTGTVILYIASSRIVFFLTITFRGFWQRPASANWIVTGVYITSVWHLSSFERCANFVSLAWVRHVCSVRFVCVSSHFRRVLRRRARVLCCELGRRGGRLRSLRRRWRRAALDLRLELCELLRTGQVLQQVVFLLQLRVSLNQFLNLFFQHLHLFTDRVHQVTLHQILKADECYFQALFFGLFQLKHLSIRLILLHVSYQSESWIYKLSIDVWFVGIGQYLAEISLQIFENFKSEGNKKYL